MSEISPVPAPRPEPAAPAQTPAQVPGAAAGSTAAALAAPVTTPASPADDEDVQDKQARAGRLEGELQKLRSELRAGAKAVMRVLPPHSSMTWAGHTVTDEPTEVPASAVAGLHEAALNAGVELIQEN